MSSEETPRPPATPEFGAVTPDGPAHRYPPAGSMEVTKLSVGDFDNDVYVVRCAETNEAIVVDGAADADRILAEVGDARLVAVVQTHGHWDHVRALEALVARTGAPVYCHTGDAGSMPVPARALTGGDVLEVGTIEIEVLHTPGHTPGSLCFLARGHLFSGDTLFPAGPGNTFGDPAAFEEIMRSLDILFALPDETRVSPGHGLDTFIGRERPYVETWRARGW